MYDYLDAPVLRTLEHLSKANISITEGRNTQQYNNSRVVQCPTSNIIDHLDKIKTQ